ncbi:gluconokinase [Spirosoma soli]|uniref:Gluconokinase n=1 Tax=Spirosoma soli TaxID=1770529 RepID=A0ABW5MDP1_9BACT
MDCLLGLDLGTTNIKVLAVTPDTWEIIAQSSIPLPTLSPQPGYMEQDPEVVWKGVEEALTEVSIHVRRKKHTINRVCVSGAMHSLLAVDKHGKPLMNALLWSDNRAEEKAAELHAQSASLGRGIYEHTGTPIHPMIPLCKLAWFKEQQPELLQQTAKFISLKEYVWWKMTGQYQVDYSIATATGLFDVKSRSWYQPALDFAGVKASQLSDLKETTYTVPYEPGEEIKIGLPAGVKLTIGASDGCLANLGAGCIGPGITTITIGTSGAVRRTVNEPLRDPHGRLFCYYLDERADGDSGAKKPYYVFGGPTNNGANVLQWVAEKLTQQETEDVVKQAERIALGADGLLFLPYLHGERAPLWDASARGAYLNVDYQHTRAHFIRAALEGVMFNLLSIEEMVTKQTGPAKEIYANGGFAKSDSWVQMMADIFGVPVRLNESNESTAMGAILLASDTESPLERLADEVLFGETFKPDAERHKAYQQVYKRWKEAVNLVE